MILNMLKGIPLHVRTVLFKLEPSESPRRLVKKKQIHGFYPRESDLVGLGWGPRISISKKLPGDSGAIVAIHRPHTMFL